MMTDTVRRGIVNQGAFFSPYYLFDLLGRQRVYELDPEGREANRRALRRPFRAAWARFADYGSTPGEAWQAWYRELFEALGFRLARLDAPVETARHGLVPISHSAYPPADSPPFPGKGQGEGSSPLVLVDLHGFGVDLDRDRYRDAGRATPTGHITDEPIARAIEFALDHGETRWAIVANGDHLRLYRKGGSVARQYLAVSFPALFDADRLDEWTAFWGLFRAAAFAPDADGKCLLDRVLEESQRHASRIADDLRENIVTAVEALVQGILDDPANRPILGVRDQRLVQGLFEETLYFLYRLLFVLYAESRDLLPVGASPVYRDGYSLEHLRDLAEHPLPQADAGKTYYIETVRALFRMLHAGFPPPESALNPGFSIAPFNGQLFDPRRTALLDRCRVPDLAMRQVVRELSLSRPRRRGDRRERYSYADLGVDQLGSIYEGLLVYEPTILTEETVIARVKGDERLVSRAQADEYRLDYDPETVKRPGTFALRLWGGRRKGSGSYYTPQEITSFLVKEALEPLVEPVVEGCGQRNSRGRPRRRPDEILDLNVCDPAMGSGAFLVQACRYLAEAYGRARIAAGLDDDGRMSQEEFARYKRRVAERCLYGVDLNPMAVELAKVSLWLETLAQGKPLDFLDAHLRCGNSLVGAPLLDQEGAFSVERLLTIPEAALKEVSKEATKAQKEAAKERTRRNREEVKRLQPKQQKAGQLVLADDWGVLSLATVETALNDTLAHRGVFERSDEDLTPAEAVALVHAKEEAFAELQTGPASAYRKLRTVFDLWCAAWFWPEAGSEINVEHDGLAYHGQAPEPPTTQVFLELVSWLLGTDSGSLTEAERDAYLATTRWVWERQRFFHWELEFPEVWREGNGTPRKDGGFDAVVGNPPWDTISGDMKEFFSNYDPLFRQLEGRATKQRAAELRQDAAVDAAWRRYDVGFLQLANYLKQSGVYTWFASGNLGKGDFNVFRVFVEANFGHLRPGGSMTQVLPDAFYLAANASAIRQSLITKGQFDFLYVVENRQAVFPIHRSVRITLMSVRRGGASALVPAVFLVGKDAEGRILAPGLQELAERLANVQRDAIRIPIPLIQRLAPTTWSPPEFRTQRDVELAEYFAAHFHALSDKASGWNAQLNAELHASSDSDIFYTEDWLMDRGARRQPSEHWRLDGEEYWPLYDGDMIYHFDPHYKPATKWVPTSKGLPRMRQTDGQPANMFYRLAWRDVSASTNERTVITAVLPPRTFAKHKAPTLQGGFLSHVETLALSSLMNSFVFDYQARTRGKGMTFSNIGEIYVVNAERATVLAEPGARLVCVHSEFGELWGHVSPVLDGRISSKYAATGTRERAQLRAEIDALVADLYGLSEPDFAYILTTFPLLDRDQPALPGEPKSFITRDLALLELFKLRGQTPPSDIVAFFADAGANIAAITGSLRGLAERVAEATRRGAVAYLPTRRGGDAEGKVEEDALEMAGEGDDE